MTDTNLLSYLAGAMDSDGYFSIRRYTYSMRVAKESTNPIYSPRIGLKQVSPIIPNLLKEMFNGSILHEKRKGNSKPLWSYEATGNNAYYSCEILLPYIKVKRKQVETILELRKTKDKKYLRLAYWFNEAYPDWKEMEMITSREASKIIGYSSINQVSRAIKNDTLLGLKDGEKWMIPKLLVDLYVQSREKKRSNMGDNPRPSQLIEWRERLYQEVRELNKMGITGTSVYHRRGCHRPKEVI